MKKIITIIFSLLLIYSYGQKIDISTVKEIYLSNNSTTYLNFPEDIVLVNIGNNDYTKVIKDKGVLYLIAKSSTPKPTNLFVKYGNNLFMCTISYQHEPKKLLYDFIEKEEIQVTKYDSVQIKIDKINEEKEIFENAVLNNERVEAINLIKNSSRDINKIGIVKSGLVLSLARVTSSANYIYYKVIINNISNLDYEVNYISISTEERPKRLFKANNASIENIELLSIDGSQIIKAKTVEELILTTKKYSINQGAKLVIQIYEKNGSRDLTLNVPSNYILTF